MKVAARRSRRAGGDADDSEWDCSDEESPDDEEEQEEFRRVGSGWAKLKGAQEEFSHKVHRAFLNFKVHPKVSTRYQQDQAEAMEIMRKEIEMEAEALRKRKEGELRKQLRERAKPKSQPKLIRLNEREKVRLLEHFNLEDDEGLLNSIENSQKVAKLALDEVAVTLKEHEWWKVCCESACDGCEVADGPVSLVAIATVTLMEMGLLMVKAKTKYVHTFCTVLYIRTAQYGLYGGFNTKKLVYGLRAKNTV